MSNQKFRSVVAVFGTQAEATARAAEYATKGFVVFVPTTDAAALPPLTGSTTEVLLDFASVVPGFPAGGVLLSSSEKDESLETIVAGVPAAGPPNVITSAATKVFILEDRFRDGRDIIAIESAGLTFDGYTVFVPTPTGAGLPPGISVTGETKKIFLDATDALRNLTLPGLLEINLPLVVAPATGSLWVVTARKLLSH